MFTVDDDPSVIEIFREILELKGHRVIAEAFNGEEAVRIYGGLANKPEIVILDHRMPIKNGIEAMKEIHAINPMQCILFVTADDKAAKTAIEMGANNSIIKPFDLGTVLNAISTAILETDNRSKTIRENLLGIVSKFKGSGAGALRHLCDAIEKDIIDIYLQNMKKDIVSLEMSSRWSCEFMNLCGFEFHYELKDENNAEIINDRCYWHEKFGTNPILCSVTRGILTRFAMKTGREIDLRPDMVLMDGSDRCQFTVKLS
ncbi:MAG: response regulator [Candidatus Thermoplasmatota archaeon]|nr:response regulator [Candidatus Thermoplasmatota archaeon]MBU4071692.1 response regulator [Candidatus Thermoplasmatota archaeon]MBU4143752.1 response regulator [Candidatus Thermoplasmatota archaeon]MBU4592435.1 response regulator [Candidatus Thermoplasmatota archaeon]